MTRKHLNALWIFVLAGSMLGCTQTAIRTQLATPVPAVVPTATPARVPMVLPSLTALALKGTINVTSQQLPWWNDTVFYEIFVRSFYDSNADGMGDFNGITMKLDYLAGLGIRGIWLMPIQPSPSYHGYDVSDYSAVNPQYGTMDDFKRLLAEAHKRGIKVIIDLVLNHTSSQHPWFVSAEKGPASPYRDYYLWSEKDPGIRGPNGETVWHQSARGDYYYGFFGSGMPDLNYRNPAVTQEMEKVVRFWEQDVGIDGFRLDAAKYLVEDGSVVMNTPETHNWYQKFRPFYKDINPEAMTVGEVWDKTQIASSYAQGDQLDLTFDFDLAGAWLLSALSKDARPSSVILKRDMSLYRPEQFATFLSNHDQNRVMVQVGGDADKARIAAALLMTAPGVPFIYYGEEIGMSGQKPDEQIRTPMQWTGENQAGFTSGTAWEQVNADFTAVNVQAENVDKDSLLNYYRRLIQMRNDHLAMRVGNTYLVDSQNSGVYAVLRASQDEALLVIINLTPDVVSDYKLSLKEGPLQGVFPVSDLNSAGALPALTANSAGGFDGYQPVKELPGNTLLVLSLKPE